MSAHAIGVDIGGTKVSVAIVDRAGVPIAPPAVRSTPSTQGANAVAQLVVKLVEEASVGLPRGIPVGVGTAGVIDSTGTVFSATNTISGWSGFRLAEMLSHSLSRPVLVLNDVHAAAVGEAEAQQEPLANFLMVTVGTGIGGALYQDGALVRGATGTAGSVGHTAARGQLPRTCTCGQTGHLEAYSSGPAMEQAYFDTTGVVLGLREVSQRALEGEAHAIEILRNGANILGVGLADALSLVDVDTIVVGGGVAAIGTSYLDEVRGAIARSALPGPSAVCVRAAHLGTNATLVGAALYALTNLGQAQWR